MEVVSSRETLLTIMRLHCVSSHKTAFWLWTNILWRRKCESLTGIVCPRHRSRNRNNSNTTLRQSVTSRGVILQNVMSMQSVSFALDSRHCSSALSILGPLYSTNLSLRLLVIPSFQHFRLMLCTSVLECYRSHRQILLKLIASVIYTDVPHHAHFNNMKSTTPCLDFHNNLFFQHSIACYMSHALISLH